MFWRKIFKLSSWSIVISGVISDYSRKLNINLIGLHMLQCLRLRLRKEVLKFEQYCAFSTLLFIVWIISGNRVMRDMNAKCERIAEIIQLYRSLCQWLSVIYMSRLRHLKWSNTSAKQDGLVGRLPLLAGNEKSHKPISLYKKKKPEWMCQAWHMKIKDIWIYHTK